MTTRNKTLLAISAAAVLGLVATPLLLARGGGNSNCPLGAMGGGHRAMFAGHFGGHGGGFGKILRELDLTDEQKTALHRIHESTQQANAEARRALHDGLTEAAKVLAADPQNVAGARAVVASRQAAIDQLKDTTLTAVSQALAVLTPEQRAKLVEHIDEHRAEHTR